MLKRKLLIVRSKQKSYARLKNSAKVIALGGRSSTSSMETSVSETDSFCGTGFVGNTGGESPRCKSIQYIPSFSRLVSNVDNCFINMVNDVWLYAFSKATGRFLSS